MEYKPSDKCVRTLQKMLADKPWFAIGQQLLAQEIQRLDQNDFENYLTKAAIYSINRKLLYDRLFCSTDNKNSYAELQPFETTDEEQSDTEQIIENETIFDYPVVDYFATQNVETHETSEDIVDKFLSSPQKLSIEPASNKNENLETIENINTEPFIDDDFVTETLAKIYAEQGYISKAIEVYEKLSLQDSKKSAYFATLIENLRKRN
jgi:predicted Zn-dependent protease